MKTKHPAKLKKKSTVLFAPAAIEALVPNKTLPAKFERLLKSLRLEKRVKDKKVGIKMHFGGQIGYTTIHPVFVRTLVQALNDAGAAEVKAMDNDPARGIPRGYTREVLGCPVVSTFGESKKYLYREKIGFKKLDHADYGGEAVDCDYYINLSHVKGHGDCGFGGALKNIGMGVVPGSTRQKIHHLEGGIKYRKDLCTFCLKCDKNCPHDAIRPDKKKKEINFFYHNCTYCQHCEMVCPTGALKMENRRFQDFSRGMALVTAKFLKKFKARDLLFINVLTNITAYCDCWGMSTPSLVPDVGILCSDDIVAIDTASLDLIQADQVLPGSLPPGRELISSSGHLFERIHGKDPYLMLEYLEKLYGGSSRYTIKEIK